MGNVLIVLHHRHKQSFFDNFSFHYSRINVITKLNETSMTCPHAYVMRARRMFIQLLNQKLQNKTYYIGILFKVEEKEKKLGIKTLQTLFGVSKNHCIC